MSEPNLDLDLDLDELERRVDEGILLSCGKVMANSELRALIERCRAAEAKNRQTYCAFCGATFPVDDSAEEVSKHIATCPKHPMRRVEKERDEAFKRGVKKGLSLFAWWKDGVEYVGTCGNTLKTALDMVDKGELP